jgi:hypothetical protein
MIAGMKASKIAISLDGELAEEVRHAAAADGKSVSAWLADAARAELRHKALEAFFNEWQREHGAFTEEELERAESELGLSPRSPAR